MERLEQNQVEMRKDMKDMKVKMHQMLEALIARSKNNLQHVITENIGPTSGFIMTTNQIYDLPPNYTSEHSYSGSTWAYHGI